MKWPEIARDHRSYTRESREFNNQSEQAKHFRNGEKYNNEKHEKAKMH